MPIKRRPQTYPAFLSEVLHILSELHEGATFKRKNYKFYLCGYEAGMSNQYMSFIKYNNVFLFLDFKHDLNKDEEFLMLKIETSSWKFDITEDYKYFETDLPLTKDVHFNLSTVHQELPEWEDMQKLNRIVHYAKELGLARLICSSKNFYP